MMRGVRWGSAPALPLAIAAAVLAAATALAAGGCAPAGDRGRTGAGAGPVTVYSGRNESLVGPLLSRFTADRGIDVAVRYGSTAEMAATLLEEGDNSPADLFLAQDAAALGAVADAGRFVALPEELLSRVEPRFRSPEGDWVGLSGRARVVVYHTGLIRPEELPQRLEEVVEPRYAGRFGVAPPNASFQAHMAVYRALKGGEALEQLLQGMVANRPRRYENNTAIVQAVLAGEIEWGLTNHYYLWRALKEDPDAPGANYFMPEGDASSFVNLAGIGALNRDPATLELVEYLLSEEAQGYFAQETYEYPLVRGVEPAVGLGPLEELRTPEIDFHEVAAALEETLQAIQRSGLLP